MFAHSSGAAALLLNPQFTLYKVNKKLKDMQYLLVRRLLSSWHVTGSEIVTDFKTLSFIYNDFLF